MLLAASLLSACGPQPKARVVPSPKPSPSPSPSSSSIAETPLPSPPTAGATRCQAAQLEAALIGASSGAGHTFGEFEFRNAAAAPCYVYGYAGMQLLDASGNALETQVIRDPVAAVAAVTLPPGTAALGKGPAGHARFVVEWVSNCDVTGTHFNPELPASVGITPPDDTSQLRTSAYGLDGSAMSVCPGQEPPGTLHTKPVEPASHP